MTRAIYVGKTDTFEGPDACRRLHPLTYGMTGDYSYCGFCIFWPDGSATGVTLDREDIYIPSEDQTRHCPKP